MKTNNLVKRHIVYVTAICLFIILTQLLFGRTCPFLLLLKIPCPTCGVTRSILSLFRLDLRGYLYYNPFSLLLIFTVWSLLHIRLFKFKKIVYLLAFLILFLNFCLYMIRFSELPEIIAKSL